MNFRRRIVLWIVSYHHFSNLSRFRQTPSHLIRRVYLLIGTMHHFKAIYPQKVSKTSYGQFCLSFPMPIDSSFILNSYRKLQYLSRNLIFYPACPLAMCVDKSSSTHDAYISQTPSVFTSPHHEIWFSPMKKKKPAHWMRTFSHIHTYIFWQTSAKQSTFLKIVSCLSVFWKIVPNVILQINPINFIFFGEHLKTLRRVFSASSESHLVYISPSQVKKKAPKGSSKDVLFYV